MADVFISYKREERARCERIAEKLKALKLDVWFDARLTAGDSFNAEIEREVRRAKVVLVLWSPGSVASRWVRNEADIGRERGVLAAVQLAPCTMPIEFRDIHYDAIHNPNFADDDSGWLKILTRIGELVKRPCLASYSQALAKAGGPLVAWAAANPQDVLAPRAREIADAMGALERADASSGSGPVKPKGWSPVAAMAVALAAAALAGGAAWFAKPVPVVPPTPLSVAQSILGSYRAPDDANCASPVEFTLYADGIGFGAGKERFAGLVDGWLESETGVFYRREGDRLLVKPDASADPVEFEPCP